MIQSSPDIYAVFLHKLTSKIIAAKIPSTRLLSCTYWNTSDETMTSTLHCDFFLRCSSTSPADNFYLAFLNYTLTTCFKFISIEKKPVKLIGSLMFQILAMAQVCKEIIIATTYTKSNLCSVRAFIPQFVCSFTYYFHIHQTA